VRPAAGGGAQSHNEKTMQWPERWHRGKAEWDILNYYQRFESAIALVLTIVIALIILVALYRLSIGVVTGLLFGAADPLEHAVFQSIFGEIMTLLIALEFNHTLRYVVTKHQSIIQTKIVLLIALLAVARKFIILDMRETSADYLLALAAITLALGVTYRLMRSDADPTDRLGGNRRPAASGGERESGVHHPGKDEIDAKQ
jgi:uncharacterized membrane protein (DUF373 family)